MYTEADIVQTKTGHVMTKDGKFYLESDGSYDYWHRVKSVDGDTLELSGVVGDASYDYCFRSNIPDCVRALNKAIARL
jgi:hypothetical protein